MSGKVLDQGVFHGAPDWVRFATVTSTGAVVHWEDEPFDAQGAWNVENLDSRYYVLAKQAYDHSNWQQSKIKRQKWLDNFPTAIMTDHAAIREFAKSLVAHEPEIDPWDEARSLLKGLSINPPNFDDLIRSVAAAQNPLQVRFKKLHPEAKVPVRATDGAAGFDLHSTKRIDVPAGQRMLLPTGIACAIPEGWCGQVWPRSGLAVKHGINRLAGLIDSDYRGELHVSLVNHGQDTWEVKEGERIAQLVFVQVLTAAIEVDDLDDTARGVGGFGSTGK